MPSIADTRNALRAWLTPIMRYERHISAAAMVAGFAIDNYTFGRIDRPATHIVFGAYLLLAAITIATMHAIQSAADRYKAREDRKAAKLLSAGRFMRRKTAAGPATSKSVAADVTVPDAPAPAEARAPDAASEPIDREAVSRETSSAGKSAVPHDPRRTILLAATQFAIGGLSSGFLVFYSRSAVFASSWLFLLVLVGFLIGNEVFKKYHSRLVFSSLLLFFSIYSYSIFVVPVVTKTIGKITFLASGAIAVAVFILFLGLLARFGRERFRESRLALFGGAIAISVAMNAFYFTSLLPPLPLTLADVGIYHSVKKTGDKYVAVGEDQPWYAKLGFAPAVVHIEPGKPLSLYSAIFAPIRLTTRITHRWQFYNVGKHRWVTLSTVSFPISGGREGGYRAYSIKSKPKPGDWRVDIATDDGRLVGRYRFVVVDVPKEASLTTKTLE